MIIKIKNLKLKTIIGIHDFEQESLREIIINVKIETDKIDSLYSDKIEDTIDYANLTEKIKSVVKNHQSKLIESLAQNIIDKIMEDDAIKSCELELDKPGAVKDVESFSINLKNVRL